MLQERTTKRALSLRQMAQAVLCNDHRSVDDQPKVECPEAHQIRAELKLEHAHGGDQHGSRDDQSGDERGSKVSEQQEQDQDDQECAFQKVGCHGLYRSIDQLGAVQYRPDANGWWQGAVDLLDFCIHRRRHGSAVAANQHQHRAEHSLAPVHAGAAQTQIPSDRHLRHVLDINRNVASGGDDDVTDFAQRLNAPADAHHIALTEALDKVGAAACIVGFDRAHQLADGQTIADELAGFGSTRYCLT